MGIEFKGTEYNCPKHGNVGTHKLELSNIRENLDGLYCLVCYGENVKKNCERLTEIE